MVQTGRYGGKTIPGNDNCQALLPDPVMFKAEERLVHKNPLRACLIDASPLPHIMLVWFLDRQA